MCIYIYVCVYVYIYIYTHVCCCRPWASVAGGARQPCGLGGASYIYIYIYICIYTYIHTYIYIYIYTYTYTYTYTHTYTYTYTYTYKYTYTYTYTYIYIYKTRRAAKRKRVRYPGACEGSADVCFNVEINNRKSLRRHCGCLCQRWNKNNSMYLQALLSFIGHGYQNFSGQSPRSQPQWDRFPRATRRRQRDGPSIYQQCLQGTRLLSAHLLWGAGFSLNKQHA